MPRTRAADRRARAAQQTLSMSFPGLLQMRLEGGELSGPHGIRFRQPCFQLRHRLRFQSVDADARIELITIFIDQAALAKRPQMPAHRRKGEASRPRELSRSMGPFAQEVDDPPAMRV